MAEYTMIGNDNIYSFDSYGELVEILAVIYDNVDRDESYSFNPGLDARVDEVNYIEAEGCLADFKDLFANGHLINMKVVLLYGSMNTFISLTIEKQGVKEKPITTNLNNIPFKELKAIYEKRKREEADRVFAKTTEALQELVDTDIPFSLMVDIGETSFPIFCQSEHKEEYEGEYRIFVEEEED